MLIRPRRNRKISAIRDMVQENHLTVNDLIYPMFLTFGQNKVEEVKSMPGIFRYTEDQLIPEIERCMKLGIKNIVLFPNMPDHTKDSMGTEGYKQENMYVNALFAIKKHFPELCLMTDVALDPYSSDGHDGIVREGQIINDETVEVLAKMAVVQAQAGADIIGPSDMMDGRVKAIRMKLDEEGYSNTSIMSYTAKYASAFYGPFRDALDSAPKNGDKKTYQMNPGNLKEALLEAELDALEGADMLMVKPGLPYLDVIRKLADECHLPITAYNVSGEYAMIKAAAQNGWLNEEACMLESLLCFKRAGASAILTYFAKAAASLIR